jgi:hypothetical protein
MNEKNQYKNITDANAVRSNEIGLDIGSCQKILKDSASEINKCYGEKEITKKVTAV